MINKIIDHIEYSIEKAENFISKLPLEIVFRLPGESSPKGRMLLNNICSIDFFPINHLEIGSLYGSTYISSLYRNEHINSSISIDNWSRNSEAIFKSNCSRFLQNKNINSYTSDSFEFNLNLIKNKINIYFYDGDHSEQSQEKALTYYDNKLDDLFILIVDDWRHCQPNEISGAEIGTRNALKKLDYKIHYEKILASNIYNDYSNWWSGFYIGLLEKKKVN